ncbi:hypothetical protein [Mycobacterium sp.]|uniref:hypothetical protein n=1 Tax=Mycobacterium sp. TaxID=1785 RepID=UPI003BAEE392
MSNRATSLVTAGRRLRIVAVVIGTVVFMTAAVGCMMSPAPSGNPGVRATTKMWPFKQDVGGDPEWMHKYGQDARTMPNLPDVAAATPEQRAAATDLMRRTEAGTAAFNDPDVAAAAGYGLIGQVARAAQNPGLASAMQAIASRRPGMMLHVANRNHPNTLLDPNLPEEMMYGYQPDGSFKLVGVMFLADNAYPGPPPTPGGPITRWHYHGMMPGSHLGMHIFFGMDNDLAQAYAVNMGAM